MAARQTRARRRPARAAVHHNAVQPSFGSAVSRAVASRPARVAYLVLGTAGLAALMVAIVGPRRLDRKVLRPLAAALEPRAEALWAEARPLRTEIVRLFRRAAPQARENLARNFQSWIGHFRAT